MNKAQQDRLFKSMTYYSADSAFSAQVKKWVLAALDSTDHMTACDKVMGDTHPCTCGADDLRRAGWALAKAGAAIKDKQPQSPPTPDK